MTVTAQPTPTPVEISGDIPDLPIYRLTIAQYHAMGRAGILGEDDPVELLEGWLVPKMTKHPPHSTATRLVRDALRPLLAPNWYVDSQEPITTLESEPEPDVVAMRGGPREYANRHPSPADIAIVVEVAESSLAQDRGSKMRIYARAGIAVYWIINLAENQIEVYTAPSGPAAAPDYGQRRDYGADASVPVVVDGVEIGQLLVRDLLP